MEDNPDNLSGWIRSDNFKELQKIFKEAKSKREEEVEAFWNGLDYQQKINAFYAVCKRIHQGELIDHGSYRYVLYQVFGFGFDAYVEGMNCGYLDIHNAIVPPEDNQKKEEET